MCYNDRKTTKKIELKRSDYEKNPKLCLHCNSIIPFEKQRKNNYCDAECRNKFVRDRNDKIVADYYTDPIRCMVCNEAVNFTNRKDGKYCSSSCAAKVNNTQRTDEQKASKNAKISKVLAGKESPHKGKESPKKGKRYKQPSLNSCVICNNTIYGRRKTCSNECLTILRSILIKNDRKFNCKACGKECINRLTCDTKCNNKLKSQRIKNRFPKQPSQKCKICGKPSGKKKTCGPECYKINHQRHGTNNLRKRRQSGEDFSFRRVSKLELQFIKEIEELGYTPGIDGYFTEVYAKNPDTITGYYRLDFVFPRKRLIVEIDGKQHDAPKQKAHDAIRDSHMADRGWTTLRINYYELNKPDLLAAKLDIIQRM